MAKKLMMGMLVLGLVGMAQGALLASDNFNDGVWDWGKWSKYTDDGSKVDENDGSAWFAKFYGDPGTERGILSQPGQDFHMEKDFSAGIDYNLTWDCPWHNSWRLTWDVMNFRLFSGTGHTADIQREVRNGGDAQFVFYYDGAVKGVAGAGLTADVKEYMKFDRVGNTLTAYVKTTGDWQTLGSADVSDIATFNSGAKVQARIWVNTDRDGKMQVDNFNFIPEPASLSLIGLGIVSLLRRRG